MNGKLITTDCHWLHNYNSIFYNNFTADELTCVLESEMSEQSLSSAAYGRGGQLNISILHY